ncbi:MULTISPECIES: hypothetical protein [unclassified Pseudomonas]|uniref:hypothetical protein n=1 Tax=unclassified Pseudomonas TaxID=196821 RepID=UPI0011146B50|nr:MULTISPECIES: hypothetical protein [unclassified Pseudomonas]
MPADSESVKCADCGTKLNQRASEPDRDPCSKCGSRKRIVELELSDTVDSPVFEMLDGKLKQSNLSGKKKQRLHFKSGQELSVRLGRYVNKERVLDKDNDRYLETVTDLLTGEVLRHCDEPLSEHQGRGSAKFKAVPPPAASDE